VRNSFCHNTGSKCGTDFCAKLCTNFCTQYCTNVCTKYPCRTIGISCHFLSSIILHHTNPPCPALPSSLYPIPGSPLIYSSSYHYTLGLGAAGLLQVSCEAEKEACRERKPPRRTHLSHGILMCCKTLYSVVYKNLHKFLCKI